MYLKLLYTLFGLACFSSGYFWPEQHDPDQKPVIPINKTAVQVNTDKVVNTKNVVKQTKTTPLKVDPLKTTPIKIKTSDNLSLTKISFEQLPGWDDADVKKSLIAFQNSCNTFLKQKPSHPVGSKHILLRAGDWRPACQAAVSIEAVSEAKARDFFEKWFNPIKFEQKTQGLFTGYYMPQFKGSLKKTKTFKTPIYGLPKDLKLNGIYTRAQIDNGILKKKAPVIAWINSPVERLSLEIEGSGVIKLPGGKRIYLGYAGENGAPYTSIGSLLIKQGIMTKDNASKDAIKRYFDNNPSKLNSIMRQNKSFVFFEDLKQPIALGAQGMALTPGYSLAIDKKWIPLGAPLWLTTTKPDLYKENKREFQRLMIAQDTGGAIRGLMRGDIYWGTGKKAAFLGEQMKNKGRFWLLLPKYMKFL